MESDTFVILSISMIRQDKYLLELVEKKRLAPKSRPEKWAERDAFFPGSDPEESTSPFMLGRGMMPVMVPISAAEFQQLSPKVGQEVTFCIKPVGT